MSSPRRLGPLEITLIVIDAVLIGVLIFLLATAPDGPDDPSTPDTGTSAPADGADGADGETTDADAEPASTHVVTVPAGAVELAEFSTPSGNIWCTIGADAASCQIESIEYQAPPIEDCDDNELAGRVLTVTVDGASFPCPDGSIDGPPPGDRRVLEYDQTSHVGDFMCTSTEQGVSCTELTTGAGFSVRRAEATLTPA